MSGDLLFVLNVFDDGAIPNILLDLSPFYREKGWNVRFLTLQPIPEEQTAVKRCRSAGFALESLGCASRDVIGTFFALRKHLRDHRPSLVHSHLGRADVLTAWAKPKELPQVTTFHSVRRNYSPLTLWGFKATDHLVSHRTGVSSASIASLYDDGQLKSPHSVIYNPVSPERLKSKRSASQVREDFGITPAEILLLNAGRFIPAKGQLDLIRAFAKIHEAIPSTRLMMAGSGPLESALRSEAKRLAVSEKVLWPGFSGWLPDLIGACDLLVFPSLWEGLGLVPIEALLMSKPVVVSRIPAIEEFVTQDETGLFCEAGDPDSIASAVVEALSDPSRLRAMAAQGRERCLHQFDTAKIAEQYLALYRTWA